MANHKSALKRVRSDRTKKLRNQYQHKTARTFKKRLLATTDKKEAEAMLGKVIAMWDKLAKRNIIHKNKAANQKSLMQKHVNGLA